MMKRLFSFILCVVIATASFAEQRDTICISGQVLGTDGVPAADVIVVAMHPADSSVIAFNMTDEEGRYSVSLVPQERELLISMAGFNVKRTVQRINAESQTLNLIALEESIILREVQIKAQKLWGSRDTLNYLVAAYTTEYDRTIGDVLKQLPGITIEGGLIKYQGVAINHFYIENMDVLQGRYGIATEGIKAEDVATVQVLENHEHVRALQGESQSESAAINLKLKDKAKGVWTKSFGVGLGYDDNVLWNCEANLMYFGKEHQHVIFYGNDNTGSGVDRAVQHYDRHGLSATVLTDILYPGSSPVGITLRNNAHTLNLSNLNKLGDTKQLRYNLTYNHDTQRRSSYQQTAYYLPGNDVRLITEDIASRRTTDDAHLNLSYENNADTRFLSHTLDVVGQWADASGTVLSNDNGIHQSAYNRNIGLSEKTHWIHRGEGGVGFEVKSNSSLQVTPQALSVSGDMTAYQEAEITRVNTNNNFALLKDLRRKRWSIIPTAELKASYVGVESILRAATSDEGCMHYLHAEGNVGTTLRYVKNEFRMDFKLPLSFYYTSVMNEAEAARMRFSPSFYMIWKANDYWTLTGRAGYGMHQTPWSQLLTTTIMGNYRTVSRYMVNLSDIHSASSQVKVNYKDIMTSFFSYVQGTVSRSWSDVIYGTIIDERAHTVLQAEYMPHSSDRYSLSAHASKGFERMDAKIEADAGYTHSASQLLRQSVVTDYQGNAYTLSGDLSARIAKPLRLGYGCTWTLTHTMAESYKHTINALSQHANLNVSILPNRLTMNVTARHTHNSDLQGKKDYVFMDASLTLRTKKKQEFVLSVNNLFNTRTFISHSNTDLTESFAIYHLRPRSVMLTTRLDLKRK